MLILLTYKKFLEESLMGNCAGLCHKSHVERGVIISKSDNNIIEEVL